MRRAAVVRSDGYLGAPDGTRLRYRRWSVDGSRAALVVVHGMGEHSGRYHGFAEAMLDHRLSVYAYDQRGHGETGGRRGDVESFQHLLADLDRFRREVQGLSPPGTPVAVVGHSLGGLVVIRYLQEYESSFCCGVLSAPWLGSATPLPAWIRAMAGAAARVAPGVRLSRGTRPELLTRDSRKVREWEEDPLVHRVITPRFYREARRAQSLALERPDRIRVPLLFLLPGADEVADAPTTEAFARSIEDAPVDLRRFPDDRHEIFNELDREAAFEAVAGWIRERLEGRAGAGVERPAAGGGGGRPGPGRNRPEG